MLKTAALARVVGGGAPGELLPSAGVGFGACIAELGAAVELDACVCLAERSWSINNSRARLALFRTISRT